MRFASATTRPAVFRSWRLWSMAALLVLAGCAGRGEIALEDTAGALVVMGVSVEGRPVNNMGYYYVLNFVDEAAETEQVVIQPRPRDSQVIIDELAPGEWTLESFAARPAPGIDGFSDISARPRPVHLEFPVAAGTVQVLSHELVINHDEGRDDLTDTEPRMAPLSERTRTHVERRIDRLGDEWERVSEPVGTIAERDETPRRSLLERILGD